MPEVNPSSNITDMSQQTSSISQANGASVGSRLATFLLNCREQLLSQWSDRVKRDPTLPTADSLNEIQLRDHLPLLLDKLNQRLRDAFNEELKHRSARVAALHGHIRWNENYDLRELIHEFAVLRSTIIPHLVEFQESNPDIGGASWQFVTTVLHEFFDDAIQESAAQFIKINDRDKKE
jgi:hypothetical protein